MDSIGLSTAILSLKAAASSPSAILALTAAARSAHAFAASSSVATCVLAFAKTCVLSRTSWNDSTKSFTFFVFAYFLTYALIAASIEYIPQ